MRAFRFVAGLTLAAALLLPLGGAASVSAAAQDPTALRLAAPTAISYDHRETTVSGTLTDRATGVGDKPVTLALYGADRKTLLAGLGTVITAADGRFSLTTTVGRPGIVRATFPGDGTHATSTAQLAITVTPRLPSRVRFDAVPATVEPNADFAITGQAEQQTPDNTWEPAEWARVRLSPGNQYAYVGKDGRFSFTTKQNVPATWRVYVEQTVSSWTTMATSPTLLVDVPPEPTQVTSFTVRSNGVAQKGLTLTVRANVGTGGQSRPYTGALDLYVRPKGSSGWQKLTTLAERSTVRPNGDQVFSGVIGPYDRIRSASGKDMDSLVSAAGSLRVETRTAAAAPGRVGVTGSSSGDVPTVIQRYATEVTNMYIGSPSRPRDLFADFLEPCWHPTPSSGYCGMVPDQPVKLYSRAPGSKTWRFVRTTRSDGNGRLQVTLPRARRYYRLVYTGSPLYAGTTGRQIYFSG